MFRIKVEKLLQKEILERRHLEEKLRAREKELRVKTSSIVEHGNP